MRRLGADAIRARKGASFPMITAYDAPFARAAEEAGIDLILVGDSLGMVVLGYPSTVHVTLDDMIRHGGAAARGTSRAHIVVDLPFLSYETSIADAVRSAGRLVRDGGASSVKLEGGTARAATIRAIVEAGIPVMAHLGVLPQTAGLGAGFRKRVDRERLIADAQAIAEAGAYAVVLEMVDHEVAQAVTEAISIPTIGIGSGPLCDGQVLVLHDVLGLYPNPPPFARTYATLAQSATEALRAYADDVRGRVFPTTETGARNR